MRKLSPEEIKQVELGVLVELDRICREHGLRYYLAFGTLIGALRHGGFIPWDDDIDVLVPRADYEQLLEHLREWRSDDRYDIAVYRDGKSTFQYAKLVDTTTSATENYVLEKYQVGLWVDLFPLDECPKHLTLHMKRYKLVGLVRELVIGDPSQGTTALRKLFKKVMQPLAKRIDVRRLSAALDHIARDSYKGRPTDKYWDVMASGGKQRRFYKKSNLEPAREVEFEGIPCFIPKDSEQMLEIVFGDWRTIPPVDQRPTHMVEAYSLED